MNLNGTCNYLKIVIAGLDRAIQRKYLDYPVKPDNDKNEVTLSEFLTRLSNPMQNLYYQPFLYIRMYYLCN